MATEDEFSKLMRFSTRAIHVGQDPEAATGAVIVPIFATSTYAQESPGVHRGYEYSRSGNPTRTALETCLATLEQSERGLAFASGLAATTAVFASLLRSGDEVVAAADLYGGTYRLLEKVFKPWGIRTQYSDNLSPESFENLLSADTKMIWVESPTNPLLQIADISKIAEIAHHRNILLVVDNTFASPFLQKPILLGADLVVHSTTKYISGHSDVVGGAVIGRKELVDRIAFYQNAAGAVPGPFDAFLTLRGIKTLALRMERHSQNAMQLAEWLKTHPSLSKVYYPGLKDHPGHEIAKKQMIGFGGMISIQLISDQMVNNFLKRIRLFTLAESLGGVESLVCHPAKMTHASIPPEIRESRGIHNRLLRLSVGIEDIQDLIEDLSNALKSE